MGHDSCMVGMGQYLFSGHVLQLALEIWPVNGWYVVVGQEVQLDAAGIPWPEEYVPAIQAKQAAD